MKKFFILALMALAVALTGCAATVQRSAGGDSAAAVSGEGRQRISLLVEASPSIAESTDWELFRAEWRSAMAAAADGAGKQFVYHDTDPANAAGPGTLVVVTVNDYRYISPGARYGFGILTGNAYIDAVARFYELPGRREIGVRTYMTSSSAWQGIFSAMTDKQVQAISTEIMNELK